MKSCFVIQPFDKAEYDERFEKVLLPAIREVGMEAYRTDRDPATDVPVADIEAGIRRAYVCIADVTKDNPNVWFELGFALACHKRVCLICSTDRVGPLPFDIRNRAVIAYHPAQPQQLHADIVHRLQAILRDDQLMLVEGKSEHLPFIFPEGELRAVEGAPTYELRDFEVRQNTGFALAYGTVVTNFEGEESQGTFRGEGPVHNGHGYLQYSISDSEHRQVWAGVSILKLAGFGTLEGYWLSESSAISGTIAFGRLTLRRRRANLVEPG